MLKERFDDAVRLKLIQEFIQSNHRVPSLAEENDMILQASKDVPVYSDRGYVEPIVPIRLDQESSAEEFNNFLIDTNFNLDFMLNELRNLYEKLSFRTYEHSVLSSMIQKKLELINANASGLLLSKNFASNLIYSITEDFISSSLIQLDISNVSISSEGIRQRFSSYLDKTSSISKLSYSVFSDTGYRSAKTYSKLDSIREIDGDYWFLEVIGVDSQQIMSCAIEVTLEELTVLNKVKLSLGYSSSLVVGLYYAAEDKNYKLVEAIQPSSSLVSFDIDSANVKYIKVVITKSGADSVNDSSESLYFFKVDSVELVESTLIDELSVLYCGPYQIIDNFGSVVNFNRASLSACYHNTSNSWIEFYLSNDNATWISATPIEASSGGSLISFENTTSNVSISTKNSEIDINKLDINNVGGLTLGLNDSYLNGVIPINLIDILSSTYIIIKRNVPSDEEVFDISSGWFFNSETSLYETTIIVNVEEGVTLDLGPNSAFIDGVLSTGAILINSGIHIFATNQNNWIEVEEGIETEDQLIQSDPLYPYNHKLLIEGYNYLTSFTGNKVYNGIGDFFGKILKYVPKSTFDESEDLDIYTTYADESNIYFLVHTRKSYDNYVNEIFDLDISIPSTANSQLFLKAVFRSRDSISSSLLQSFTLRVA